MNINLIHLYPQLMNTYGDTGNIICLKQRCAWRHITLNIIPVSLGEPIPKPAHLYFMGGGQDAAQSAVSKDILRLADRINQDIQNRIPLLAICGGYQLLGKYYLPFNTNPLPGTGLFPVETQASHDRMIGNLIIEANPGLKLKSDHQTIVGFENHSGKTSIVDTTIAQPLGTVLKGFGNNGTDHSEGCLIHNAIGCYLHGSLLPKNPHLADWLLEKAFQQVEEGYQLTPLKDTEEWNAHHYIVGRYL